ncbi:MAG TPA: hypothetical protein VG388_15380 [Solirubrobacteraceae bacterium]|jgi:hypothetical protein|nr:hypothetical protein [Solirubrobacteraceae bacterium]
MTTLTASITIRPAYADDEGALARLAALDSADVLPPAPRVIAEVDGELRAAVSLWDGSAIADPFFPTADVLALLRVRASRPAGRLHRILNMAVH